MAEKKLTKEELDQVGLECIKIDWDNKKKISTLFNHFKTQKEPLPSSGVNDKGDLIANLSLLSRLAKVIQGKQVFKALYARTELDKAIKNCGIQSIDKKDEKDETKLVREKMQDTVDSVRRASSTTDKKLQTALDKVNLLSEDNLLLKEEVDTLKQKLSVTRLELEIANKRVFSIADHESIFLKSVF